MSKSNRKSDSSAIRFIDLNVVTAAFYWVGWINALVLGIAFNFLFLGFALLLVQGVAGVTGWIVVAIPLAIVAYFSWKNIDVLNAAIQPFTLTSYLLLSVWGLIVLALSHDPKDSSDEKVQLILGALVVVGGGILGFLAVGWLRIAKIKALDMKLSAFIRLTSTGYGRTKRRLPYKNAFLGWLLIAGGLAIGVGAQFLPYYLHDAKSTDRLIDGLDLMAIAMILGARTSGFAPRPEAILAVDHRPPVLVLRLFYQGERIRHDIVISTDVAALFDFPLESRFAGHFSEFGPVIDVDRPKAKRRGAGRRAHEAEIASEPVWQPGVARQMESAALIIAMARVSDGPNWEITTAARQANLDKLILCFAPYRSRWFARDGRYRTFKANARARMAAVKDAMANTLWSKALAQVERPQHIRSMFFAEDGRVCVVRARSRSRSACHLAVLVAHHLQMENAQPRTTLSKPIRSLSVGQLFGELVTRIP